MNSPAEPAFLSADRARRDWEQPLGDQLETAAERLYHHLLRRHWTGQALVGPDPIGKVNWRITRFVRGYTRFLPWRDQHTFLQAQAYWIQANLNRYRLTGEDSCLTIVEQTADWILRGQNPEGGWNYTLPERRHLIGAPEGTWAGIGLLAAFRQLGNPQYLIAAQRWYDFQVNKMGFARYQDGLVPNFYNRPGRPVPNVATMCLRFYCELQEASGDQGFLEHKTGLVRLLGHAQMTNGEMHYVLPERPHFQCFQYNSYQFLDLAEFYLHDPDERVRNIMQGIASFLATGVTPQCGCRFNCDKDYPEVNYWNAALASALRLADELQLGDYAALSQSLFRRLLSRQSSEGGFDFSTGDYRALRDRRSYPRTLAMILSHLGDTALAIQETPASRK